MLLVTNAASAQSFQRELAAGAGSMIEVTNMYGRVSITVLPTEGVSSGKPEGKAVVTFTGPRGFEESDIVFSGASGRTRIEVAPKSGAGRIDVSFVVPARVRVKARTGAGEITLNGDVESAEFDTETGTIAADVPLTDLKYSFSWSASRPRLVSDVPLEEVKEKAAGRFGVSGRYRQDGDDAIAENPLAAEDEVPGPVSEADASNPSEKGDKKKGKAKKEKRVSRTVTLNFTTDRGIVLLNVPPNEVSSDLRERPLTKAAKAIIRSGDSLLTDAIRRASPKYFGDYAKTLPPARVGPAFTERRDREETAGSAIRVANVRVSDIYNRSVPDLKAADFEVLEDNRPREILSVEATNTPFNLVLLLDVSGSVDNYVNFIRKAARSFVDTMRPTDRISMVSFNDDVKVISGFTADKRILAGTLDSFDAGGGTAYYDALAYTLVETLRPMKGERTAIVILTDGDDNRSFLAFDSLLGSIQESGALIYPLYVPSDLIAASDTNDPAGSVDAVRTRYMGLTSKAQGEGERLAKVSGGVYYPITRLSQIQAAYDDIVLQLRTAYSVKFRSEVGPVAGGRASPRLRVRVKRENVFASLGRVYAVTP